MMAVTDVTAIICFFATVRSWNSRYYKRYDRAAYAVLEAIQGERGEPITDRQVLASFITMECGSILASIL